MTVVISLPIQSTGHDIHIYRKNEQMTVIHITKSQKEPQDNFCILYMHKQIMSSKLIRNKVTKRERQYLDTRITFYQTCAMNKMFQMKWGMLMGSRIFYFLLFMLFQTCTIMVFYCMYNVYIQMKK